MQTEVGVKSAVEPVHDGCARAVHRFPRPENEASMKVVDIDSNAYPREDEAVWCVHGDM